MLPKNLWRSIATRDPLYLTETAKYLAGPLYEARLDAKTRRAAARRTLEIPRGPGYRSLRPPRAAAEYEE